MIFWISLIFLLIVVYLSSRSKQDPFSVPKGSSVLLVIAHPDDEAMFFGPTLTAMEELKISVQVLCLSNGNSEGLGKTREKELSSSLRLLGVKNHLTLNLE